MPLATLLSQVLVAYTIEFDNEFELRLPHRTSRGRSAGAPRDAPWCVSLSMWSNLLRVVDESGLTVAELQRRACIAKPSLAGMQRWGYIKVAPDPADRRPKPPARAWLVQPTAAGLRARDVWKQLFPEMERRWIERFGVDDYYALKHALVALVCKLELPLPEYMPVVGYGLLAPSPPAARAAASSSQRHETAVAQQELPALLSKLLLSFTLEFERGSDLSLAICADLLRVLNTDGVRVRDLPQAGGISRQAVAMALNYLARRGHVRILKNGTRSKRVKLTARGHQARASYRRRLRELESAWRRRFGADAIEAVRTSIERLLGEPAALAPRLMPGLTASPGCWRAASAALDTLPHHPMVLHRGGYPDGA